MTTNAARIMTTPYRLFNFQSALADLRYLIKEGDSFQKVLDAIPEDAAIEDMPFYRDYLSKFNLGNEFDGLELLINPNWLGSEADYDLFKRFVYASFSCSYDFRYIEAHNAVEMSITASNGEVSKSVKLHDLWKLQLQQLFMVF